jgi:hypothetical protein
MANSIFDEADENPELRKWLEDGSKPHTLVAGRFDRSATAVRRWRKAHGVVLLNTKPSSP